MNNRKMSFHEITMFLEIELVGQRKGIVLFLIDIKVSTLKTKPGKK